VLAVDSTYVSRPRRVNGLLGSFIQRPRNGCIARIGRDFLEGLVLQAFPRILGRHYFAIFVLASATLSYQILITRFFSVMLYYHFAFAAISLAMLGLTRGATAVYNNPARYTPEQVGVEFARHASRFAMTGVGAMIAFLCAPLVIPEDYVTVVLALTALTFVMPFTESGVCITLLLTRTALCGRPFRGGARMPRGHLRIARRRSRERHLVDRSLCRRCGLASRAGQR
jgi:hypothetical protein